MAHALKEWAAVCRALASGRQVLLLRKGGISEPGGSFQAEHPSFFLFPTFAHQRPELLVPEARGLYAETLAQREDPASLRLELWAVLHASHSIADPERLAALEREHVLSPSYATERLRWKPRQPLWALVVRVHRIARPPVLDVLPEHGGCVSWVDLPEMEPPEPAALSPVLSDEAFSRAAGRIESALR